MFETADGNPIPPGYFVTLEADKVRIARTGDRFVAAWHQRKPGVSVGQRRIEVAGQIRNGRVGARHIATYKWRR